MKESRSYNVGTSDYSKHKIQPWDIWEEYQLNPWDADIVKRVLRTKAGESRVLDYKKIIHICQERIRQLQPAPTVMVRVCNRCGETMAAEVFNKHMEQNKRVKCKCGLGMGVWGVK